MTVPNFSEIAKCFDLKYAKIEKVEDLEQGLTKVFESTSSILCEIHSRYDQSYIELGYAKSSENKRFVRRPLEDQTPFIDRELLKREMIIDLIDQ